MVLCLCLWGKKKNPCSEFEPVLLYTKAINEVHKVFQTLNNYMVSIQDLQYLLEPWEYWGLLVLHLFEFETADTVGVYIEA